MSRMLDVEQLVTLCVHLNREETVRLIEYKITQIIYLKHTLELVEPLRETLAPCANELFNQYSEVRFSFFSYFLRKTLLRIVEFSWRAIFPTRLSANANS